MLNMCVKYVNNWRIGNSKTGDYTSTIEIDLPYIQSINCLQVPFINQNTPQLSTTLSTYQKAISYLLNKSFAHNPQYLLLEPINEI